MNEELLKMVEIKRAWTEAAKCAEKEGSIVAADFARGMAKAFSRKIVGKIAESLKEGAK